MQYVIYCDESEKKGKYYSHFYGGSLVRSTDLSEVIELLDNKKAELNLTGEVKWTKVTANYLEKYIALTDLFFDLIKQDKVKIRIMFTHNRFEPDQLSQEQKDNEFFLLYYQFFKHAFGLQYSNSSKKPISLFIFFDQLPDKKEKNEQFKEFVFNLQYTDTFKDANLFFHSLDDIAEAVSHKHVILQCLDVVLGSIEFRLNEKHKEKPPGQHRRGKRTIAKEKLYKFINQRIREIYPGFNIGESTGISHIEDRWTHPYRHWKFASRNSVINNQYNSKNKR